MFKKFCFISLMIAMLLLLVACSEGDVIIDEYSHDYSDSVLTVTGDVTYELDIADYSEYETTTVDKDDQTLLGVYLADVLSDAVMYDSTSSIIVSGYDGVMAQLSATDIADCVLVSSSSNGWQLVAPSHSPQAGVKNIEYIVVVTSTTDGDAPVLGIIDGDQDTTFTYGQLYLENGSIVNVLEATASSYDIDTGVYSRLEVLPIANYITSSDYVVAYFSDGSQSEIEAEGYIEWRGNSADYVSANGKTRIAGIIGIWADAPELCLTDIAGYVDYYSDYDILIIEVDALGHNTLYGTDDTGASNWSYVSSLQINSMRVVMPSISNVGLAAIMTGLTPDQNGVSALGDRQLIVDDIFTGVDNGIVVEGSSTLISLSIEQQLNADTNGSGSNDDEVFASALTAVAGDYSLMYVHFHGYDDTCHSYGPYSAEAATKAQEIDSYVQQLIAAHDGIVMIISDHGQHETGDSDKPGAHGTFIYEDMAVPFVLMMTSSN